MVVTDELILNVRANTAQAVAGLGAVEAKTKSLAATASASMTAMGMALTKGVTLPLLAIGGASMKGFANFDAAMTQSLAIMSDNALDWRDDMERAARDVGKTTTFSATQAAESYFYLASAGLDAQQSIAAMPQVAKFAQAGMFDLARATDLATDAQSALGLKMDDPVKNLENLTRVTDVFVRANSLANATVEEFSSAITTKAGAAARTLGMDIEETTAVLGVLADQGVKGQVAGTQLAMALNNMTSNAVKNSKAFDKHGIAVFDSAGNMRNMADIVEDMTGAFGDMSDEAKVAAIMQLGFGDRAANTLKFLIGNADAMREYESELRSATGFTDRVAGKQLESFSARWTLLKSKIADVGLTIGNQLLPPLTDFVEKAGPVIERMGEWIENNSDLAKKIAATAAAIGPLLLFGGKLISLLKLLNPITLILTGAFLVANQVLKKFGKTWSDVLDVARDVAARFGEWFENISFDKIVEVAEDVVGDVVGWFTGIDWTPFTNAWNSAVEKVKEIGLGLKEWWDEHWDDMVEIWDAGASLLSAVWEDVWATLEPLLVDMGEFFMETFGGIVTWFEENWPKIKDAIVTTLEAIEAVWDVAWPSMAHIVEQSWKVIKGTIEGFLNIIQGIIEMTMAAINMDWDDAWDGMKKVAKGVFKVVMAPIVAAFTTISNIIRWALEGISEIWSVLWWAMSETFAGAWGAIQTGLKAGVSFIISGLNKVIDAWNNANLFFNSLDIPRIPDPYSDDPNGDNGTSGDSVTGLLRGALGSSATFYDPSGVRMASGGIATRPVRGVFGEAGREAVLPLEGSGFRVLVDAYKEAMRGEEGESREVVVQIDGREIARATDRYARGLA